MGVLKKGILGGFSGTVGTVVGSNWRGKDIIRSLPKSGSRTPSEKQMVQQAKFKKAVSFLAPLRSLQAVYFGNPSGSQSRNNMATSHLLNEAIEFANGEASVIYSKVLISKGEVAGFADLSAQPVPGAIIQLQWSDNSVQAKASADDVVVAVCYCVEEDAFHIADTMAKRNAGTAELKLPDAWSGKNVHIYAFLRNADESQASISTYAGMQTLI